MNGGRPPSELPASADAALAAIEPHLRGVVESLDVPPSLRDAIAYALLGGGKRLRPVLAWHCAIAAGGDGRSSLRAGAAVELVHAFSLVHDDLPAMDDDDVRRGRPTLHKATSEALAILAGDGMLTLAFGVLAGAGMPPTSESDGQGVARLSRELFDGTLAMITGQVYDTLGGLPADLSEHDRLALIHRNKTGGLLRAACRMGAICGSSSERALGLVTRYADSAGLMFQIVDDVLDVTQPAAHVGKKTGKDAERGKLTYPGVLGLEASRSEIARLEAEAVAAAHALGASGEPLAELARYMAVRTK